MFKSVLFLAFVFAIVGLVAAHPVPMPLRHEFEIRHAALDIIPAYVKRVDPSQVNNIPAQDATMGVNGDITQYHNKRDPEDLNTVPAQDPTTGFNGDIVEYHSNKRDDSINTIPAEDATMGINGDIVEYRN